MNFTLFLNISIASEGKIIDLNLLNQYLIDWVYVQYITRMYSM